MSPPLRNPQPLWFFALAVSNLKHHNEVCTARLNAYSTSARELERKEEEEEEEGGIAA